MSTPNLKVRQPISLLRFSEGEPTKKGDAFDARWKFFPMKTCMKNHSHKLVVCGPCFRQSLYDTNPNNALLTQTMHYYY